MRKIFIKESQISKLRLAEAAMDSFSFEELNNIKMFKDKLNYCKKMLGPSFGKGSARICFELNDEWVLKLAYNQKGIGQNEEEYDKMSSNYFSCFPKIDENNTPNDYSYIVAENVLPAKESDFKFLLGFGFSEFKKYIYDIASQYSDRQSAQYILNNGHGDKKLSKLYQNIENDDEGFIAVMNDYMTNTASPIGDLLRMSSYGLVKRTYGPELVLIDAGLSVEVFNTYYRR